MILDQFGRPVHPPLMAPTFIIEELLAMEQARTRERRINAIRALAGTPNLEPRVGQTIRVRLPRRYQR